MGFKQIGHSLCSGWPFSRTGFPGNYSCVSCPRQRKNQEKAMKVYYENDADLNLLKDKTVAIIGYGSQGHAHAQNLRDSGIKVVVGQRPGGANYELAKEHGFEPVSAAEAAAQADLIMILLPDQVQAEVYKNDIAPNLKPGNVLAFGHGFNI